MEFEQDSRSESPIENSEITVINSGESDVTLVSSNCLVVPDDREISSASKFIILRDQRLFLTFYLLLGKVLKKARMWIVRVRNQNLKVLCYLELL